jgi:LysM repeat protein
MTNPNPFLPKGSLLEQQTQRRSRLKLGVFCVIAVSSLGLVAMLIQGCKREQPVEQPLLPELPTNTPSVFDNTNAPVAPTNQFVMPEMPSNNIVIPPPSQPLVPEATPGTTYKIAKGDTLGNVAKAHHVSLTALQAANPGVDSKHLKIGQSITIPAASATTTPASPVTTDAVVGETYTVKSGDTLTTIAKKHGVSLKALKAANSKLDANHIKVGDKVTIPSKAAPVAPVIDPAPTTPLPVSAPVLSPAPAAAPVK